MTDYNEHPVAALFPLMQGAEYRELLESIALNGQRDAIVVRGDQILDGRNRYRICRELQIPPKTREFDPQQDGHSVVSFIIDVNLRRRHLRTSQKAVIGASIYKELKKEPGGPTQEQIAGAMGISRRTLITATGLLREDPEEAGRVASGEKTLHAARSASDERYIEERLRDVCGEKFAEAFKDGTIKTIQREIDAMMALPDAVLRKVAPLVVKGWTTARAVGLVTSEVTVGHSIKDLIQYADTRGGEFVCTVGDYEVSVTRVKRQ